MVDGVAWALVHGSRLRPMMVVIRPRPESPPMKHSGPEEVGPDALPIRWLLYRQSAKPEPRRPLSQSLANR
jgi:hypothetical protein